MNPLFKKISEDRKASEAIIDANLAEAKKQADIVADNYGIPNPKITPDVQKTYVGNPNPTVSTGILADLAKDKAAEDKALSARLADLKIIGQ